MSGPQAIVYTGEATYYFYSNGRCEKQMTQFPHRQRLSEWMTHEQAHKEIEMSRSNVGGVQKIGNYEVPTPGLKIKHVFEPYKGEVLMIANAKYASPSTTVVVFRGDDNEIYSRPLEYFWDNWRKQSQEYVVQATVGRCNPEFMRRRDGRIDWVINRENATRFSKADADHRISLLVDAGAAGNYHRIPV